jgi:hypothetical protein
MDGRAELLRRFLKAAATPPLRARQACSRWTAALRTQPGCCAPVDNAASPRDAASVPGSSSALAGRVRRARRFPSAEHAHAGWFRCARGPAATRLPLERCSTRTRRCAATNPERNERLPFGLVVVCAFLRGLAVRAWTLFKRSALPLTRRFGARRAARASRQMGRRCRSAALSSQQDGVDLAARAADAPAVAPSRRPSSLARELP